MKKLELKHLASYFPYKLKCITEYGILELNNLTRKDKVSVAWFTDESEVNKEILSLNGCNGRGFRLDKIKPILRPLSGLTKEIEVNGEDVNMIDEIYSESWMAMGYYIIDHGGSISIYSNEDDSSIDVYVSKSHLNEVWVNDILIKNHFDTQGLIEGNLAIDINTL